ncbi:MAG: hypothetical protein WCL49_08330 [bacterium]
MIRLLYPRFPMAWRMFGLFLIPTITMAGIISSETSAISESSSVISRDSTSASEIEAMASGIADSMVQEKTGTLSDLAGMYRQEQIRWLIFAPPSSDFVLRLDFEIMVFAPKTFPEDFNKNLIGEMKYGCPVYTLSIAEDPVTHETVFSNADGGEIARLKPEEGYNPFWLLDSKYPDLYSGLYGSDRIKELEGEFDPSRIQITVTLLPIDYLDKYALAAAEEKVKQASFEKSAKINPPMRMYQSSGMTNLEIVGSAVATNGMKLTLAYPDGFTNRVDIFTSPDLIGNWWDLVVNATNVNTSTNFINWVDANAFSQRLKFYNAENADLDSDGDGLSDAREKFMYHTSATNSDSDVDGLSDSNEVFVAHTDPNNSKTNTPIVWISYPIDESRKVWLP